MAGQQGNNDPRMNQGNRASGREGASYSAMNDGTRSMAPMRGPSRSPEQVVQDYRRTLRDLEQIARGANDNPELAQEVREIIAQMQRMDPSRFSSDTLVDRIQNTMLPALTALEAQLRLKELQRSGGVVRSESNARVPEGYGDAVAEYFRKLNEKFAGGNK